MLTLGIDPGTQIMGYALLDDEGGRLNMVAMDVLYLRKIKDYSLRLRKIFDSTVRIIDSFHPDHLAIESQFFGINMQSVLKLGKAQGVTIAAALSRGLSYTEYEPAVIKQTVTGNGNATKEQVASMLRSIIDQIDEPRYYDATDALAVAYTCHMQFTNPYADLRSQLMPKRKAHKSAKKQWADFVNQNPDLMHNS